MMDNIRDWIGARINRWVILGALVTTMISCVFIAIIVWVSIPAESSPSELQTALVTVIPLPKSSPKPIPVEVQPTITLTSSPKGFAVGVYVQVTGTGGEGLRLRSAPGIDNIPKSLGAENDRFQLTDGPAVADGYTWWFLVSPDDKQYSGWAVEDFLTVIVYQP